MIKNLLNTIKNKISQKTNHTKENPIKKIKKLSPTSQTSTQKAEQLVNPQKNEEIPTKELESPTETNNNSMAILPLRNLVVFPEMVVPILVARPDSVKATQKVIDKNKKILIVTQKNEKQSFIKPEKDLYSIGVIAEISQFVQNSDSSFRLIVSGQKRVRILKYERKEDILLAHYQSVEDSPYVGEIELEAAKRHVNHLFSEYLKLVNNIPDEFLSLVERTDDISQFAFLLAGYLPGPVAQKQKLLQNTNPIKRLYDIASILEKECNIQKINQNIQQKANKKLKKAEKEYILKEQLKVIQEELNQGQEEDSAGSTNYEKLITKHKLPPHALTHVKREIKRLNQTPSFSPEAGVIRSYLDFVFELPWHKKTKEKINLDKVQKVLDNGHFGLEKIKERIIEFLAVKKLSPQSKGAILCFVGPPGTGKTSLARSVADALGRRFIRLALGGVRDEAEIRGHRRTYIGALPGRILAGMKQAGVTNPLILLDEIDKMDSDMRGDPTAALLEVLDPEQNHEFSDHFLEMPYDLSNVMFITTANILYSIPEPLMDRLEIIQLSSYTEEEKIHIASNHLIPKQIQEHGIKNKRQPQFSNSILQYLIQHYTKEAGVRNLERKIATICRKIAKQIVDKSHKDKKEKHPKTMKITKNNIEKYLGPIKFQMDEKEVEDQIGIATGLAWTEVGGTILPIEVATMPGKGNLVITGQIGDVMQESAKAALSYLRAHQKDFKLPRNFIQEKVDLHVHVPEGAVPKDGPSAGIAIASAILSALTKKPISSDVAMTGEITLRGRVLPIGGLKEKVLAAHRAGIPHVLIPQKNTSDLQDIPKGILKKVDITPVHNMDEVIKHVLVAQAKKSPKISKK